mgnify:CR=1 FL=1
MALSKDQQGASKPLVLLFLVMATVILTVGFKLFPVFYENWQIESIVNSFEDESDLEIVTVKVLSERFYSRLTINNVRDFDYEESVFLSKDDGVFVIEVDYEVRIPIYRNIDAVMTFEKVFEKNY